MAKRKKTRPGAKSGVAEPPTAKIFQHGRSQAVRLPKEFRLPGKEVHVRHQGAAVVLEPIGKAFDTDAWFQALDQFAGIPFMEKGREQPALPADDQKLAWE